MAEIIAGTYKIIDKLGSGGGGVVYLAEHLRLNKKVVLKEYNQRITKDEAFLRREVNTLKDLKHTYIPQVYDFFSEDDKIYAVIDYVPGESLDRPLKRGERFSQPQVIKWARQLLEALAYLHSPTHGDPPRGYVHSDIKPANLMKTPDGDICLIDFNIAFALDEDAFIGMSIGYASPEHYGLDYSDLGPESSTFGAGTQRSAKSRAKKANKKEISVVPKAESPWGSSTEADGQTQTEADGQTKMEASMQTSEPSVFAGNTENAASTQTTGNTTFDSPEDDSVTVDDRQDGETQHTVSAGEPEGSTRTLATGATGMVSVSRKEELTAPVEDGATLAEQEGTLTDAAGHSRRESTQGSGTGGAEPPSSPVNSQQAGSPEPPKKKRRIIPDVRSDIYSVGATLYHLLSGVRPAKEALDVEPLSKEDFSPMLVDIISKAMMPNPDLRYQTAAEMLEAFDRLFTDDPRVLRLKKRSGITFAFLAALLCAGICSSFVGLKRIQTLDSWLTSVEYSKSALAEGDVSAAVRYALAAVPGKTNILTPPAPAAAKAALAEALGVYDLSDGFKSYDTISLPSAPLFVAMAPDGSTVACVCSSRLLIFDTGSRQQIAALPTVNSALAEARYLDAHTILYAGEDGLTAYDLEQGKVLWQGENATGISISADGTRVAAIYRDESLARVYDTATGALTATVDFEGKSQRVVENDVAANPNDNLIALNGDGTLLAVSFSDGGLTIFDLQDDDSSLICLENSDHVHFEGGFYQDCLAFSATGGGKSIFSVIDFNGARQTGGFSSTMPFLTYTDETGIYVSTENVLVRVDPVSGEQEEVAYTGADITGYLKNGSYTILTTADGEIDFFGPRGALLNAFDGPETSCFLTLSGGYAAVGNRNDASLRLFWLENHAEAQVFSYDPSYTHNEARLSADGNTVMLFRYDGFRLYSTDGELLAETELPDAGQVYDQQYRRDAGESWLQVIYNSGLVRKYSARDGALISEKQGDPPDGTLFEEYLTDFLRIEVPLHGAPTAYNIRSGKEVAELEKDDYLAYVTQSGEYVITEYITAEGSRYGLVLDKNCETVARLPNLCDVLEDGTLLFDDMLGNLRKNRIFTIEELTLRAKE